MLKSFAWLCAFLGISVLCMVHALAVGSADIAWSEIVSALMGGDGGTHARIILDLRLPRAINAFVIGGLLALSGALLQVLLRNPLADPYVLGVSGGAAVGALIALLAGLVSEQVSLAAMVGAVMSMLLVFALGRGQGESGRGSGLLLTGVVLASAWGAVISFVLSVSPQSHLPGMLFWLMGDLSGAEPARFSVYLLIAATAVSWVYARDLNLLARGALTATLFGVSVPGLEWLLLVLASVLTASAVTIAGSIGFVGLIIPHMVRLMVGADHRRLLPACVLLGGSLLCFADTLSRSVLAPRQIPVGVVTALIGTPVFLYLLRRMSRVSGR